MILVGITIEILGAFTLAAEAIGIERLNLWIESISGAHNEMKGDQERKGRTFLDPNRFICAFASMAGVIIGFLLIKCFNNSVFSKIAMIIFSGFAGGFIGIILHKSILRILLMSTNFLLYIETKIQQRAVGVLGFILLVVGFVFQFVGVLIDCFQ